DFVVNWTNVWLNNARLRPERLGYRIRHKNAIRSVKGRANIWDYGADLEYRAADGRKVIWLCKLCHQGDDRGAAKVVDSHQHIVSHLFKAHRIDINKGLMPDTPSSPSSPWEASKDLAGSRSGVAH
ncbi:hypothetical protein EJ04DRAFT_402683, partial [Polyplosphaeria fusca]